MRDKLRILVIEENNGLCADVSRIAEGVGHSVTCGIPGRVGLDAARDMQPDVIILDVTLPGVAAFELINRLNRQPATRHIPIIVVSEHLELEYELLNIFDFIPKPPNPQRLLEDFDLLRDGAKRRILQPTGTLSGSDYTLFHDFLITHCGLHFERRNLKLLERGVMNRMQVLRIRSFREYFSYLSSYYETRQELQKLLQFLTVGETYFFRYTSQFEALKEQIIRLPQTERIHIWSAGCSTGEEAYSLAITIIDLFPDWKKRDIRIYATDINNRALQRARDGVYGQRAVRVTDPVTLERHFQREGESYRVRDHVRSLVKFSHLNLQTGNYPAGDLSELDVIFCRNVMIYFTTATSRTIIEKMASTLRPGGLLFLGHAETLFQLSSRFERVTAKGAFFYRNKQNDTDGLQERKMLDVSERRKRLQPTHLSIVKESMERRAAVSADLQVHLQPIEKIVTLDSLYEQARELFEAEKFGAAEELLNQVLQKDEAHLDALVLMGFILANGGRFNEAVRLCDRALGNNDLLPEAYFLRGLVYDMEGETEKAAAEYQKAILLSIDFLMPHYNLGKVYFRLGQGKEGVRELRNTLRLLERTQPEEIVPFSGGLSREVFLGVVRNELARVA